MSSVDIDRNEPIAIVGMGLRFPGGINSPQTYWDFLVAERNALREAPQERWDGYAAISPAHAAATRRALKYGSYLDDVAGFDAEFFGVSPRESELIDPQQRITLEVAWEALEHAGILPQSLAGSDTSVFMGVCTDDYGRRMLEDLPRLEAWMGIGSSMCGVANRLSYVLDLRGPSVAVDTACSASLVAIHQACQALRLGETDLALAGGVMLVASPAYLLVLEAAGALAPDGRSKAFDASADGYGRGEGCGVLALKRLSQARRDGDRIHALIRGSAVCQDGRTNGIMAPSQEAQEELVRRACRAAGVSPASLDYVEAHGTGTGLGDLVEIGALSAVAGADRSPEAPLLVGSVKTNIGHLEAASGVAGLIKMVLSMQHGAIPATLSATVPNTEIPWETSGLSVVDRLTPWPDNDGPRRSGTGNYGYGGTIAHVILEEAPQEPSAVAQPSVPTSVDESERVYPLSSATLAGVAANAGALADWVERSDADLADIGHTLAHRRQPLNARAAVVAADRAELVNRLRKLATGTAAAGVATGTVARGAAADAVWVFSGHGAQWVGMGRELLDSEPAMAETMAELGPVFRAELGFDPHEALLEDDFTEVGRVQAMTFAIQVGLTRIWQSYGLRPAAIVGHSIGEIAAAVAAGMLDLPQAAHLVCRRSRLLRRVAGQGGMAMVNLPFDKVTARLADVPGVAAAVAASPTSTVISGPSALVEEIADRWRSENLVVRRVNSDVAFHSPQMDGLVDDLRADLADLVSRPATVPVYTTALTEVRSTAERSADYWVTNLRNPVRFEQAIRAAVDDGHRVFLEISAHPIVQHSVIDILAVVGVEDGVIAHSLRRERPQRPTLLENLGTLHCAGVPVDWASLQPGGDLVDAPTNEWQHRRYWIDSARPAAANLEHDVETHTLLGARTAVQGTTPVLMWRTFLDDTNRPYPGGHAVLGTEVIPAAATLNTLFQAAENAPLRDVALRVPIGVMVPHEIQVVRQDGTVRLSSRLTTQQDDKSWLTHASAEIADAAPTAERVDPETLRAAHPETLDPSCVWDRLAAIGVVGIGWPWEVEAVRRHPSGMLATVVADPTGGQSERTWASLTDAALSVAPVIFPGDPLLRMPGWLTEATLVLPPPPKALIAVRLIAGSDDEVEVDVEVRTLDGDLAARFTGVRFGAVRKEVLIDLGPEEEQTAEEQVWQTLSGPELRDFVLAAVREVAAGEVRLPLEDLDVHRPLAELGADSLMTVAIQLRLERRFRTPVPSTLLWNRPTVAAVAEYLTDELTADVK
ncbi:acyltransferase domain-containing protein [Micromonospora sp. PSH03]|uniref:type I polyketide synthase n=1 Tax=Micromonospora TaxID=1873 RepID=UPI001EE7AA51|nr:MULTISPECIES: type I polyketide synthase [Micromonospora]MCG5454776.1 acyltransferase domain-containing protein [Micromonospora salmantinae]